MFCKHLDILSPQITLYNKDILYHTSKISIILSIFCFFIIGILSIGQFLAFYFGLEKPKLTFYSVFLEEAGSISFNPNSFFHFININKDNRNPETEEFDFQMFRIIGFETYLEEYINNRSLNNFNHWLYGPCDKESDIQNISTLVTDKNFAKYACIKKYFDLNEQKYIDINESNFRWPEIEHGTKNFSHKFYSVIIEKCEENTLNEIYNDNRKCKQDMQFEQIKNYGYVNFYFIDQQVDEEDHLRPIKKYYNRIENKISKDSYCINNIYLNPIILLTYYNGIFKNNAILNYTQTLDRSDIYILPQNKEKEIYMGYYIWLNKRGNFYSREYMTLTDAISNIGGISNVVISFFIFINKIFNKYAILSDSKELFSIYQKTVKKNKNIKNEIKLKNLKNKNIDLNKSIKSIKEENRNSNFENDIQFQTKNKFCEKIRTESQNTNFNDATYIDGKNYKYEYSDIITSRDGKDIEKTEDNIHNNKENLNFCKYLIYNISCGKAYKHLKTYEKFKMKIISVENLLESYLNINNLIEIEKIKDK